MANDLSNLCRIGELFPRNGLNFAYPKISEGYANKHKISGRANVKGDMHVVGGPQNTREKSQIVELNLLREVIGHRKLRGSERCLLPVLNAIRFLECSNRVQYPNGDNNANIESLPMNEHSPSDSREHYGLAWSLSKCKSLSSPEWETLTKTQHGCPRGSDKGKTMYDWIKVLRRLQKVDPNAYFDIANTLISQFSVVEPSAYSCTDVVRTFKASEKKRGFSMTARTSKPYITSTIKKSSWLFTPFPKGRVRKSNRGRLQRSGSTSRTPPRIGVRSPKRPSNYHDLKRLSPLLHRKSQLRFKLCTPEENKPERVSPPAALRSGMWRHSWPADAERKATVILAQWRMYSARRQYQAFRHAAITIQRQWRQSRRLYAAEKDIVVPNFGKSDICSNTQRLNGRATIKSGAESLCNEVAGEDTQRSLKTPGCLVQLLCDNSMLQEEVFAEFLSFLPSPERDLSVNDLSSSTVVSPDSFRISSTVLEENNDEDPQSPPSKTKTWNCDPCNLDSPVCSPAKELTFAKISIDGSLPPTPIKEWSSRKRDLVRSPAAVPISWNYCTNDIDHHSPTKDWATPPEKGRNSTFLLAESPQADSKSKWSQLPSEWFADLDDSDISDSCCDTSQVISIAFSPPSDPSLKPLHGFTDVPTSRHEMMVPTSPALVCIPKDSNTSGLPFHHSSEDVEVATSNSDKKFSVSNKLTSSKAIGSSYLKVVPLSERDVDSLKLRTANVPARSTDYLLSSALEEELIDELAKLFEGSPIPPTFTYPSTSPGGCYRSISDLHCSGSVRFSDPEALSRICNEFLINDGFSHSARKLDFNLEDFEKRQGNEGNEEECLHIEGKHMSGTELSTMVEEHVKSSSPLFSLPKFTPSETAISNSDKSGKILDGIEAKFLGMSEELDDVKASRDSRSCSKICQCTVQDFLQLVDQKSATSNGASKTLQRGIESSLSTKLHGPRSLLTTFANEDDFCDKAVDGNVVAVESTMHQVRNLLPDAIHSIGREAASATESLNPGLGQPLVFTTADCQEKSNTSSLSKKYFLQSPSLRIDHGKMDSDAESVSSTSLSPSKLDSAFAEVEKKAGKKHARALFTCQESSMSQTTINALLPSGVNSETTDNGVLKPEYRTQCDDISHHCCFEDNYEAMLKQRDNHRLWFPEELSGSLIDTSGQESDCSFRRTTSSGWGCGLMTLMSDGGFTRAGNPVPSLHDLCKVWDEECIDLVTRSLKYKLLMIDPVLLCHEVKMAFTNPDSSSSRTLDWEIQSIGRLKEKTESKVAIKELIKHQRDTIYTNIATNTRMRERHRLYSMWGIRRMSTGRLRKLVYELLWKDPKRYHASADLVIEYL
uniref:lysozyme n=1 Tax=Physcomitrium patens TaxID=3218 RepID=A0A7I4DZC8_PHYPA